MWLIPNIYHARFILVENRLAETIMAPPIHSIGDKTSFTRIYAAIAATTNSNNKITMAWFAGMRVKPYYSAMLITNIMNPTPTKNNHELKE